MEKRNIKEEVTTKIIMLLDKVASGDCEFWIPLSGLAYNPVSKHTYTSINQLLLSFVMHEKNYSINSWMTFKQVNEAEGPVNKGETAFPVTFTEVIYLDKQGFKITPTEAKQCLFEAKSKDSSICTYLQAGITTRRFLKYYLVFNVAQTKA